MNQPAPTLTTDIDLVKLNAQRTTEALHRFDKLEPTYSQIQLMDEVRASFQIQAATIINNTKPSREQSNALTALEEAKYWTNQAIALHGIPVPA